jgi:hypothetical protein
MDKIGTDYTSYKDLSGKISIDFPGDFGKESFDFYAKSLGIDIKKYRPFGIEIYAIESYDTYNEGMVRILAYDVGGNQNVVRFNDIDTFKNLLSKIWRLSITVTDDGFTDKSDLKLEREIEKRLI